MSTKERKPRRTLDQDFIDGAAKLVTQEGYKNPSDRATYLGTINHIDIPMERSAVLLVGQAMLGNGGGRWNTGSKDSYPDRSTYPKGKSPGRDNREIATSDHETKKPLESQGNQGFSPIGPAGFEPTTSTTPTKRTTPSGPTKTKGKRNTQGNGCTNGCTCDRCLLELADALKGQLSIDERRKLAVLLLQ
jgi:hypothetical protein